MEAKKFLIRELTKLAKQLGDVRLRYRYDEREEAHVVEVTPKAVFSSDKFMLLGIEVEERFNDRFPDEWLAFISDDNGMGIDDFDGEEYTICGAASETLQRPTPARRQRQAQEVEYA